MVIKWEIQRVHEANGVGLTDQQLENIIAMKTGLLINQSEVEVSRVFGILVVFSAILDVFFRF